MTESNETPIGAVRTDQTEKPEATVMRDYAQFAKSLSGHLTSPERPTVALIGSHAAQFSVLGELQLEAQRNAVRALAYNVRMMPYAVAENQIGKLGTPKLALLPSAQALTRQSWDVLLNYVRAGGNLLVTGPLDRDEHWQKTNRFAALRIDARTEPITCHNASLTVQGRAIPLSFDQTKQTWLEATRFADGSTLKEVPLGKGRIYWAAYPLELAQNLEAAAELYKHLAGRLGIVPMFELQSQLSPGILVYPTALADSLLYVMTSESAEDSSVDLRDTLTGVRLSVPLRAGRAALAVIGKKQKAVVAKYGF
jgi:hypothetical protein